MRPEAALFTAKDGREFILVLDHRGIIAAEKYAEAGFGEILKGLAEGRLGYLASLILGSMKSNHPDMTMEDVWDLLEEEEEELGKALGEAVANSRPSQMALKKVKDGNPPKAGTTETQNGTGAPSSPRGAKKGSRAKTSGSRRRGATASS